MLKNSFHCFLKKKDTKAVTACLQEMQKVWIYNLIIDF